MSPQSTGIKKIHQILVGAVFGDAIFNEAQLIQSWLREWGYASDIFAEGIDTRFKKGEAYPFTRFPVKDVTDTLLIFHYSIGSDLTPWVKALSVPIFLIYHNITPSEFFKGVHQQLYEKTRRGREELYQFSHVPMAVADSEFNRLELEEKGFANTDVLPLSVDVERYLVPPDSRVMSHFEDDKTNLLFVGRIAPNKKQEDIIRAFYYYKKINPASRLFLVGSWSSCLRYKTWLDGYIKYLGVEDVHITGLVSTEELVAYYRLSDVFICMSEHEGFCVPLVESMYFDVPILAFASTGVPYTLDDAGILFMKKDFPTISELIHLVTTDEKLKSSVLATQRNRLKCFTPDKVKTLFRSYIEDAIRQISTSIEP